MLLSIDVREFQSVIAEPRDLTRPLEPELVVADRSTKRAGSEAREAPEKEPVLADERTDFARGRERPAAQDVEMRTHRDAAHRAHRRKIGAIRHHARARHRAKRRALLDGAPHRRMHAEIIHVHDDAKRSASSHAVHQKTCPPESIVKIRSSRDEPSSTSQ